MDSAAPHWCLSLVVRMSSLYVTLRTSPFVFENLGKLHTMSLTGLCVCKCVFVRACVRECVMITDLKPRLI